MRVPVTTNLILDSITCPNCQREQSFDFYSAINNQLTPGAYQGVLDGSTFLFECLYCDFEELVHYETSVSNYDIGFFVHLADVITEDYSTDFIGYIREEYPMRPDLVFRAVTTLEQLIEKVQIFTDELDDRVIELLKVEITILLETQDETRDIIKIKYIGQNDENQLVFNAYLNEKDFIRYEVSPTQYGFMYHNNRELLLREGNRLIEISEKWLKKHHN